MVLSAVLLLVILSMVLLFHKKIHLQFFVLVLKTRTNFQIQFSVPK